MFEENEISASGPRKHYVREFQDESGLERLFFSFARGQSWAKHIFIFSEQDYIFTT